MPPMTRYHQWFHNLQGIRRINVATYCFVPEPSCAVAILAGIGSIACVMRRRTLS